MTSAFAALSETLVAPLPASKIRIEFDLRLSASTFPSSEFTMFALQRGPANAGVALRMGSGGLIGYSSGVRAASHVLNHMPASGKWTRVRVEVVLHQTSGSFRVFFEDSLKAALDADGLSTATESAETKVAFFVGILGAANKDFSVRLDDVTVDFDR